jgi:WGR domain
LHFPGYHAQTSLQAPCPADPHPAAAFAETASLVRIRPERNEFRYYRVEVWPDLFGRALLVRHWGRIGTQSTGYPASQKRRREY